MTRLSWAAAAVRMAGAAARPSPDVAARGRDVVEELRGLVPYSGALLARWEPSQGVHEVLAADGYDPEVTQALTSATYTSDPKWPVMQAMRRPLRWYDVPGHATKSPFYQDVLKPHGFLEGITLPTYNEQGYVGMLVLNVESKTPPHDDVMELLSVCSPSIGSLFTAATAADHCAILDADGTTRLLGDHDPLMSADVLAAARAMIARRRVPARFLVQHAAGILSAEITATEQGANDFLLTWSESALPRGLTMRELDIVSALADGLSNGEISGIFEISDRTVSTHVEHILRKLGVGTRTAAAAAVIGEGIYLPLRRSKP